jgi:hypothetical protein
MIDWGHIAERYITHVFMDAGFLMLSIIGLLFVQRKKWLPSLPQPWFYILACAIPIVAAWLREPFDVAGGQWVGKVYFDWVSHLHVILWMYLIHRFSPTLYDLRMAAKRWRSGD